MTKKAKAVAHLLMTNKPVAQKDIDELFISEIKSGNEEVILELFDLIPSEYFGQIVELIKDIDHPTIDRLLARYEEFLLEQRQ